MRRGKTYLFLWLTVLLLLARPCVAAEINVSAAASLKEVLTEIAEIYGKKGGSGKIVANLGGSGMLAKQIENGAPADIFISANVDWIEHLKATGLLQAQSVRPFSFNELVFVASPQSKVSSLQDLLKLNRIAIGSPKSVPAGEYAMRALKAAGLQWQLEKKLVFTKDVRECLMYAERGDVDGAFVYRSDALLARHVAIRFAVPRELASDIIYPMAMTAKGAKKAEAVAFYRFLQGGTAKAVLAKYGFPRK